MLTAQDTPIITPAVRLEHSHLGIQVFIADISIGSIEEYPVWGLTDNYDAAIAQGCGKTDIVYLVTGFPYRFIQSAIGAVQGAYLGEPVKTETLPDYI
jgi:hypothetical protein